jgi:N-acetylglutamate synthase-like GNAT family acetyltransferase
MIRKYFKKDFNQVLSVINDGAAAYKGIIPESCWHDPYMPENYLKKEIEKGVKFHVFEKNNLIIGVMGIQYFRDVTLIRHAYVMGKYQNQGVGTKLLKYLLRKTKKPILIGTWAKTLWSIKFYEKHNFRLLPGTIKDKLLLKYWEINQTHRLASVVLGDKKWYDKNKIAEV